MISAYQSVYQRGVVLLVSLLVLLLMALVATAVARTNLLQMHMAGNDEAKTAAMQYTLALVDGVLADEASTPVTGPVGYRVCAVGSSAENCNQSSLSIDDVVPVEGTADVFVTRVGPLRARMPAMYEGQASSSVFYRAAKFEIRASYDGTEYEHGRSVLVQGVLVRLAATEN